MILRRRQPNQPPRDIDLGPGPVGQSPTAGMRRAIGAVQLPDAIVPRHVEVQERPSRPQKDPATIATRRAAQARAWWADPANRERRAAQIRRGKALETARLAEDMA